jgi:hypothetical protein
LILRDALIHERPKALDVRPLPNSKGGGYALQVGPYLFQFSEPPEAIARRLEAWFGFFFEELLPKTADVLARPNAAGVKRLLRRLVVRCPECGIRFRALQGHNG